MTGSNVSNLLVMQTNNVSDTLTMTKSTNLNDFGSSFENTINNVMSKSQDNSVQITSVTNLQQKNNGEVTKISSSNSSENVTVTKQEESNEESKIKASEKNVSQKDVSDDEIADKDGISEKLEDFEDKVKSVLKDELGVSDEEIDEAMEVLGLTAIDLIDPNNIAKLVLEINGDDDFSGLLVSDEFKNIFDQVSELTNELFEDLNLSADEIKDLFKAVDIQQEPERLENTDIDLDVKIDVSTDNDITVENVKDNPEIFKEVVDENVEPLQVEDEANTELTTDSDESSNSLISEVSTSTSSTEVETDNLSDEAEESYEDSTEQKTQSNTTIKSENLKVDENIATINEIKAEINFNEIDETVSLPTGETVNVSEIIDQIVENAKVLSSNEQTTMEMTLNPEGLGKIYMEVTQKGSEVTAKLFTENEAVKTALENQMANLKTELNNSSEKITSIEVSVGTHEFERNLEENEQGRQQSEEQARQNLPKRHVQINLADFDNMSGLMSEEDMLVAQIMRENGNTLNYQA